MNLRSNLLVCLSLLLLAPSALALGSRDSAPGLASGAEQRWAETVAEGMRAGIPRDRLEAAAARLDAAGLQPEEAKPALLVAYEAARSGLPAGSVLAKIEEGALKRVDRETLARVARGRLEVLEQARSLLTDTGHSQSPPGTLVTATALALESGLPASALRPSLERAVSKPVGQAKAVVEAGEALHLEGLDSETVGALMLDAMERNLRRPEMLRVVRYAGERHREGMHGTAIRQSLWAAEGPGPEMGPGSGPMMGQGMPASVGGPSSGSSPGSPHGGGGRPPRGGHR